ncbi:DUF5789 family protein [Halobaculum gomorrense]|uniref:DUF2795 domain-containing protein n=1 Tax=Halobaculum gomorrense TaxID=43928 RepID=A0A1M5RDP5_9EURY|nr:DUF5789 family protein [Halobaculum gomorrense]SHH24166.1 hypothetical protein SAMN05443636_2147 [Halobaculum gomorrense]
MQLSEAREAFDDRLSFPVDRETVDDRVGDVRLEAPNGEDTTVGAVLERTETTEFASPGELHDTVAGLVDDAFVGRKRYDDRGNGGERRDDEQSF